MTQDEETEELNGEYQRETFNDEVTDIEKEDTGDASPDAKPWDPSKIRISTRTFSLRQIVDMIADGEIDLAPDFQRYDFWSNAQQSKLIESILLGIPLPTLYFNQDQSGAMQVVDGVQRLTSIWNFIRGERLSGLIHLKPLDGRAYADIEPMLRRRFQQAAVMVHVIEPQTPDEVKLEVFKRISSGAKPLTTNEIRHCMSCSRSRELLARLTAMPSFHEATGHAFKKERRMADREFVLRFCAFRLLATLEDYRKFQSMDAFLLDFVRQVDGTARLKPRLADHMVNMLEDDFDRAMHSATAIFGDAAFRKYSEGSKRRGPLNRALFDSWAVTLADYEPARVEPHKSAIVEAARQRMAESAYNEAISGGTGNYSKVKHRFEAARQIMHEVLQ